MCDIVLITTTRVVFRVELSSCIEEIFNIRDSLSTGRGYRIQGCSDAEGLLQPAAEFDRRSVHLDSSNPQRRFRGFFCLVALMVKGDTILGEKLG